MSQKEFPYPELQKREELLESVPFHKGVGVSPHVQASVLNELARFRESYESQLRIAKRLHLSVKQVGRAVRVLEACDYITCEEKYCAAVGEKRNHSRVVWTTVERAVESGVAPPMMDISKRTKRTFSIDQTDNRDLTKRTFSGDQKDNRDDQKDNSDSTKRTFSGDQKDNRDDQKDNSDSTKRTFLGGQKDNRDSSPYIELLESTSTTRGRPKVKKVEVVALFGRLGVGDARQLVDSALERCCSCRHLKAIARVFELSQRRWKWRWRSPAGALRTRLWNASPGLLPWQGWVEGKPKPEVRKRNPDLVLQRTASSREFASGETAAEMYARLQRERE